MLYSQLLAEFLLDLKLQNYSGRTMETYLRNNQLFISFYKQQYGSEPMLEKVTRLHYKLFISEMMDAGRKSSYINMVIKCNKIFWNYLVREGIIAKSPLVDINQLKEEKTVLTTFTDAEVKRMLNVWKFDSYLGARNKCIIAVLTDCGIRVSELLRIEDADIADNYIKIHGKGNKWRVVPVSDTLKFYLIKYQRIRDNHFSKLRNYNGATRILDSNLFLAKTGKRIKTAASIELIIKNTAKKANVREVVRASPHTLRHYWSIKNLQMNQDIYTISKILGHQNLRVTSTYLSSITDDQVINKALQTSPLDALLNKER